MDVELVCTCVVTCCLTFVFDVELVCADVELVCAGVSLVAATGVVSC